MVGNLCESQSSVSHFMKHLQISVILWNAWLNKSFQKMTEILKISWNAWLHACNLYIYYGNSDLLNMQWMHYISFGTNVDNFIF